MPHKKPPLIIDFWSDYNRGDAMMQVATLQLFQLKAPTVVLDSGFNEYQRFSCELDETAKIADVLFLPSPKLSYFYRPSGKLANLLNKILGIFNIFISELFFWFYKWKLTALTPDKVVQFFAAVDNAPYVIWNGRNFRSNSKFTEVIEFYDLCCAAFYALRLNKPVIALGISAWTAKSFLGRLLLKYVFSRCEKVFVRESFTLDYLSNSFPEISERFSQIPDLSFYYMTKNNDLTAHDDELDKAFIIGVVLKDPVSRNGVSCADYVDGVLRMMEYTRRNLAREDVEIRLIDQAVLENERNGHSNQLLIERVEQETDWNIFRPVPNPSLSDLSTVYQQCDFIISSRMHACIESAYFGVPFIGLPYDSGAKWSILKDLGTPALLSMEEIADVSEAAIHELFCQAISYDVRDHIRHGSGVLEVIVTELRGKYDAS